MQSAPKATALPIKSCPLPFIIAILLTLSLPLTTRKLFIFNDFFILLIKSSNCIYSFKDTILPSPALSSLLFFSNILELSNPKIETIVSFNPFSTESKLV